MGEMTKSKDQPERHMAARALVPGAVIAGGAFVIGYLVGGWVSAVSAFLGVALISVTFALYVLALGWARRTSPGAWAGVTLFGWLMRVGVVIGCLFAVDALKGDVAAFGISAIAAALAVAVYEAWYVLSGRLQVPIDLDAAPTAGHSPLPAGAGRSDRSW
jgi:hypothetical protein